MTIDEAIKHCNEIAERDCSQCAADHKQLAVWLTELKVLKGIVQAKRNAIRDWLELNTSKFTPTTAGGIDVVKFIQSLDQDI